MLVAAVVLSSKLPITRCQVVLVSKLCLFQFFRIETLVQYPVVFADRPVVKVEAYARILLL